MTTPLAVSLVTFVAALLTVLLQVAASAQITGTVDVTVHPTTEQVVLGESFEIDIDITNNGTGATPPLVIHIDITDPTSDSSVDPEDWTSTLSKTTGVIEAGQTHSVTWSLQPISPGTYSIYAVALSPGIDNSTISNIVTIEVADQRSLNPGGILPVALATPTIVGVILVFQTRRNRVGRSTIWR